MMKISNTGFLCGYFTAKSAKTVINSLNRSSEWQRRAYTSAEKAGLENYYLPEFATYVTEEVPHYTRTLDAPCALEFADETVDFRLTNLQVWAAPFDIIMYAVGVYFEQVPFDSMTRAMNALRSCAYYDTLQQPFVSKALLPIIELYNIATGTNERAEGDVSWLVESGNKFRLFQILSDVAPWDEADRDYLLYDAATLARHTPLSTGMNSASYCEQILADHRISVFNGWTGLALLDTFTLLSIDTPERVRQSWVTDYFSRIFIYQLFRKAFLYSINLRYRQRTENVEVLEQRLSRFEQNYSYPSLSYNFLPNIINEAIERSLSTQQDYEQLDRMISREMETRQQVADERTNKFLTFLTVLTLFSAVYDFTCLVNDSVGFEDMFSTAQSGFRFVSTIMLLVILVVYLVLIRRSKRR